MRRLLLPAICVALTPHAHALIDTDTDGLSDIWESRHAFTVGANPPANEAPGDDPDGDGFTNLAESRAGTDPNDEISHPAHAFSLIPPVYEALPPGVAPPSPEPPPEDPFEPTPAQAPGPALILIDPPVSILTWPTVPGKTYEAIPSEDLADWSAATGAYLGDGTAHTFESETLYPGGGAPPKLFWRVEINDTDSDEDGLTDYEELHITDPANPSKTLDPLSADTDGDGIPDGDEYIPGTNGLAAFTNYLTSDPDGPHGLPDSLGTGLIARWDLEGHGTVPPEQQAPYHTLARYIDSVGTNHIVPFHAENKPEGMPSKGAGTTSAGVGFLCPPRNLLHNRTTYSVSLWAKIEQGSMIASRPLAALFTHHRRLPKPVPYQAQYKIDINGMWIERLANGTQILRGGTSNFINYVPGTNQQVNGTWSFNGVATAAKPAGTYDDGRYHHFLLVQTSGSVSLYMDGELIGTNSNVILAAIHATNETRAGISLGRYYGEPAEDGIMYSDPLAAKATFDRVRLWSRTVTAAEAESLFKQDIENDGLWDITEERTRKWDDHNLNAIVESGEFAFVANPLHADLEDSDHDTDEITSVREQNETATDIAKRDTDGDGLPDGFEDRYRPALNPLVVNDGSLDPEGDGLTTAQEYAGGTNPTVSDAHLYPPTWMSVERSLRYDFDDYGLSYPTAPKKLTTTATWPGAVPTNEDPLVNMIPFADLGNIIAQRQPFPATFPPNKLSPDLSAGGSAVTVPTPPCHHASLTHRRIIVKVATATPEPREFKAILLTERTIDGIEQPDEAETLTLTVPPNATQSYPYDLIPTFTDGGIGSGAYSETIKQTVIKYEITEVISDQIAGNEANKLPTAYYGEQPNNPMLMGTRLGQNAKLQVVTNVPPGYAHRIRIGVKTVNTPQILGSARAPEGVGKVPLTFNARDGSLTYEVVIGFDANKNFIFDEDEIRDVFQKTPKTDKNGNSYSGGDVTYAFLDKIIIVTRNDFKTARQSSQGYATNPGLTTLANQGCQLLNMFSSGGTAVAAASNPTTWGHVVDASVIPSPQGLSHPIGAKWDAMNRAETFKISFPATSFLSQEVVDSNGFEELVSRIIMSNKPALVATATAAWQTSAALPYADDKIAFGESDDKTDVHLALGKCKAAGTLSVKYRSSPGGKIEVSEINCSGVIDDLYDFAYGTKLEFPILGFQIDLTKDASRTQAGHTTLASAPWPNAGRIFFTETDFASGWKPATTTVY